MLLFRIFAPVVWYWAVHHLVMGQPGGVRRPWLTLLAAGAAAGLYALLRDLIPYDYSYTGVFLYHAVVVWIPLLFVPLLLLLLSRWRHPDADHSLAVGYSLQWGAIISLVWLTTYVHDGVWGPQPLFLVPGLVLILGILPPLLHESVFCRLSRGSRHVVWLILIAAAAAGSGVQMLYLVHRWVLGTIALMVLGALTVAVVVWLIRIRSVGTRQDVLRA